MDLTQILTPKRRLVESLLPRSRAIDDHAILVNARWWGEALTTAGVPGSPLRTQSSSAGPIITRSDVFLLAGAADADVLRMLWHALAWGGGRRVRLMRKRIESVARDTPRAVDVLARAIDLAQASPSAAYDTLYPSRRSAIPYLGPAFFTKVLYFAGGGEAAHPSLILDARTARSLRTLGWDGLRTNGWTAGVYASYCDLLRTWADDVSEELDRRVGPDEIEKWLFDPPEDLT